MRSLLLASALVFSSAIAFGDTLDYRLEVVNDELCGLFGGAYCTPGVLEFTIPSNPTPATFDDDSFVVLDNGYDNPLRLIQDTTGTGDDPFYMTFRGSVLTLGQQGDLNILQIYGPATGLYAGPTSSPTLITGTFDSGAYVVDQSYGASGTLTITDLDTVPTPEPSSLVLLGTGALGALGTVRHRRRNAA